MRARSSRCGDESNRRSQTTRATTRARAAVLLFVIALADAAVAQAPATQPIETLTLGKALELALAANLKLDNAELDVQKATDSLAAARTQLLPSLHLGGTSAYNLTPQEFRVSRGAWGEYAGIGPVPSVDTRLNAHSGVTNALSASVVQPLLQLYRINLEIDQFGVQQSMAEQQLRSRKQDTVKQVKQQYYEILKTQSDLTATDESIAFYKELSQLTDRYVREKVALEYQLLETQARLARSEHKARSERNALQTQQERLNNLLGRDVKTRFRVTAVDPSATRGMDQSAAEATALDQRPEVREARLKLTHAQTGYRIKKSEYLPDLNLSMRYLRLFNTDFIPEQQWTVGLEMRWEFFDWGRKSQDLSKRTADITQAHNDLREAEAQVRIEVDARLRELDEAGELVKVTELTRTAAREKLRVLTNQYRERAVLLKDVLQAESELADANSEYQKSVLSLYTAQTNLEKALGND